MLEKMREGSQGVAAKIILGVIILSFALAGVGGYLGSSSGNAVVTVNGEEITQQNVEQAYQNERARLQQQYGEQFDLIASNPNFAQQLRAQATQTLITERVIAQTVEEMGLRIGDEQVKDAIRKMPEFHVDGKFDNDLYLSLLRSNNLTPSQFSNNFKRDLVRIQLLQSLVNSEFVLPSELEQANQLQAQKRVARILNIKTSDFIASTTVTDEQIDAYYQENSAMFQNPEEVSVEYILLDSADLAKDIVVTDEELQTYYDHHQSDYQRPERRKVAHILIQGDSDASAQKAQDILVEIEAGEDFGKLAKEKSDDAYSAKNSGELDWFERGVMDPAFDDSAFSLTKDSPLSGVVKSNFGYHIIKLVDIEEQKTLPLTEVKEQVTAAVSAERVKEVYDDLYQRLSEVAFESPDSLEDASNEVGINVQSSELFSQDSAPAPLNSRALLSQVFSESFRDEGLNSEIIELDDSQAIVVRAKDYQAASTKPLTEVQEQITQQLKEQQAAQQAKQFVELLMAKLQSGESISDELTQYNLTFDSALTLARYSRDHDSQVIQKLFQLPKPQTEASLGYVVTAMGDYALIELTEVIEPAQADTDEEMLKQLSTMLDRSSAEATYQALVAHLLSQADIKYISE